MRPWDFARWIMGDDTMKGEFTPRQTVQALAVCRQILDRLDRSGDLQVMGTDCGGASLRTVAAQLRGAVAELERDQAVNQGRLL